MNSYLRKQRPTKSRNRALSSTPGTAEALLPPPPELLALLREETAFLLIGHVNPDGDAVGSALALAHLLTDMGKQVAVVFPSPPPESCRTMPGADMIATQPPSSAAVPIILDCDDINRLEHLAPLVAGAAKCAELDHHTATERTCDIRYVDPQASAVGILIHRILRALGRPLTPAIATCIYWAVATDTGFFRFGNTDAEALSVCAECVHAGADPAAIANAAVGIQPLPHLVLKGRALAALKEYLNGRVLLSAVTMQDFAAAGADRTHTDQIIDDIRRAPGPDVYVLFKASGTGERWDVSLRSSVIDCAQVARGFSGGGHAEAAGFSFTGPLAEARKSLLDVLAGLLPDRADE